ncbi:MAG: 6-bladed beta-propeller [Nitrospirales bacterium]|nr:6-bladed beta-propeller [Nitrospirales bacterium]
MKGPALIVLVFFSILGFACAPSKAYIDKTAEARIVWPGPPEKPRIQYEWSISSLSEDRMAFINSVTGLSVEDASDPKTSDTLMRPYGVFVDQRERLYITDTGACRVAVVDLPTSEVMVIGEAKDVELLSPVAAVADPQGRIFVSDSTLRGVFVFDAKGDYLSRFDGEFSRPTGLAIDADRQRIYVADTPEHRVYIYNPEGKRTGTIGRAGSLPGEFNFPTHLFVDKDGILYVTDALNFRIQLFSPDGVLMGTVGSLGDASGNLEKPKGVATDSRGNIYIVDSLKDTIKIFDRAGNLLLFFGEKGQAPGEFWLPAGIFIDSKDRIYVADPYNMRVQSFRYIGENSQKEPGKK